MRKRDLALILLLVCGLSLSFGWGFVSHRDKVFPYRSLRSILVRLGIVDALLAREVVKSRSPTFERLAALGYVDTTFDPDAHLRGVISWDPDRAFPGFNLYNSRTAKSARLVDMDGRVVHDWKYETPEPWQHTELLPGGRLLIIEKDLELILLDSRSRLVWQFKGLVHHDLDVFEDKIYVLNRRAEMRQEIYKKGKTLVDFLSVVTLEGDESEQISILDLLQASPYAYLLPSLPPNFEVDADRALDILHTNHVEVIDGSLEHRSPLFKKGNLLLSSRNINAIFIVDQATREIIWLWGPGNLTFQHHPQLLENGNILLFDNGLEASRVVELDPLSRTIVWSYDAEGFFSESRGSVQRLPNGNTLVTESDTGYVFEVDPAGEVLWTFANPDVDDSGNRSAVWRMTRYAPGELSFIPRDISPIQ